MRLSTFIISLESYQSSLSSNPFRFPKQSHWFHHVILLFVELVSTNPHSKFVFYCSIVIVTLSDLPIQPPEYQHTTRYSCPLHHYQTIRLASHEIPLTLTTASPQPFRRVFKWIQFQRAVLPLLLPTLSRTHCRQTCVPSTRAHVQTSSQ